MITAAQRISPARARLWLPFDGQWRQDVGANLLTDGGFELVGTANWVSAGAPLPTLQKELVGAYEGLQWMSMTGVSGGLFRPVVNAAVVGYTYRWAGVGRGDATTAPRIWNGAYLWFGTSAIGWQLYDLVFVATSAECRFYNVGASGMVGFDAQSLIEYPLTTRNLGGMPGAPTYVRLGDGHTASTVPNQRTSSRGISLDGGDYARVPMDFEYNEPFSISVLTDSIMPAASWLAATYDSATARGIRFGTTGSGALVAGMFDDGGRSITLTSANNVIPTPKQPRLYTLSYDGGLSAAGLTMWIDDQPVVAAGGGTALASSVSSGRDLLLGARWNAAAPAEILAASNIYCTSEYDTVLDSYELRMLKKRMMQEMRVGA